MSNKKEDKKMKPTDKRPLVPKLRFPGFTEPWTNDPLAKTLTEHKLKNNAGRDVFSVSLESGIVNQIEHLGRSFAASDTTHYNLGRRYDVVYTKSPLKAFPFGIVKQCKFDGEVALSPLYGVFTPTNPHVGLMIEAYFESPNRSKAFLAPLCQKGAKNTIQITNSTFLTGQIPLPSDPKEQQKIADCLSSLDELISLEGQRLDALKAHKKGMMQQLFPGEGETVPRLRFPEFRDAGEWKENNLGTLANEPLSNGVFNDPKKVGTGYKLINVSDMYIDSAIDEGRLSLLELPKSDFEANQVRHGDIFFTRSSLVKSGIAVSNIYLGNSSDVTFDGHLIRFRANTYEIAPLFAHYLFKIAPVRLQLIARGKSATMTTIAQADVASVVLLYPKLEEQQRIADCLSSVDGLINAQTERLADLKIHKKGLMQQLFPTTEANI